MKHERTSHMPLGISAFQAGTTRTGWNTPGVSEEQGGSQCRSVGTSEGGQ